MDAALLTIGNEVVAGDVTNTNAAWLARELESLGVSVVLAAAVKDEITTIAEFVNRERVRVNQLILTGGLGGTPDDLTREALAYAFAVPQQEVPELAAALRRRFPRQADYAAGWARLPRGSRVLANPRGGAPGFAIANVWALPGLPAEMEAMFAAYAEELRAGPPIGVWRASFATGEGEIAELLERAVAGWPGIEVGSYPSFDAAGSEVEVVLKSRQAGPLAELVSWLEPELARRSRPAGR